jgi:hypothetical protein
MSVALLVVTDGRDDYLAHCVASVAERLHGPIIEWWMFDDTGDRAYRARLADRFPRFNHINGGRRQGFGGAIRYAWARLQADSQADFVFHLEQDFVFTRDVALPDMVEVLDEHPHLVQMALRRQAWNPDERAAGGVVQRHPGAFRETSDDRGRCWLEHRLFFTTNPSLYRRSLCAGGWPAGERSEGAFTMRLCEHGTPGPPPVAGADVRFGYWGSLDSGEWVEHIGQSRARRGYGY